MAELWVLESRERNSDDPWEWDVHDTDSISTSKDMALRMAAQAANDSWNSHWEFRVARYVRPEEAK